MGVREAREPAARGPRPAVPSCPTRRRRPAARPSGTVPRALWAGRHGAVRPPPPSPRGGRAGGTEPAPPVKVLVAPAGSARVEGKTLKLRFFGRMLDQLGRQAYHGPAAALAEMVANAWDADAENVSIRLPDGPAGRITIQDDGSGMTFEECEQKYLNAGYGRRRGDPAARTGGKGRRVMGRRGIGKFACFGIANTVEVETVSGATGEKTSFVLDADTLRGEEYLEKYGRIPCRTSGPGGAAKDRHGTRVTLSGLTTARKISGRFPASLARRFLVHHEAEDFKVEVNGVPIPQSMDVSNAEFCFPRDYPAGKEPDGLRTEGDWGFEDLKGGGRAVRWRIGFRKEPISDEEIRGISVFANGKLAHEPFFFNAPGAAAGSGGRGCMFGQVAADFLDRQKTDVVSTERQRVNWDLAETQELLEWGRERTEQLLELWGDLRADGKLEALERFSDAKRKLDNLKAHERKTVEKALAGLARADSLSAEQYGSLAYSFLAAWEGGRLGELRGDIAGSGGMSAEKLLGLLAETDAVAALNVAEAVKTKLAAIAELKRRVGEGRLERAVRDHVAGNPWLIEPGLEGYRKEIGAATAIREAADESGLAGEKYEGRTALALYNGTDLMVMEFARPGQVLDWDHVAVYERYVDDIRFGVENDHKFESVSGCIVADEVSRDPIMDMKVRRLRDNDIRVYDWGSLLDSAEYRLNYYMDILAGRGRQDGRLAALLDDGA